MVDCASGRRIVWVQHGQSGRVTSLSVRSEPAGWGPFTSSLLLGVPPFWLVPRPSPLLGSEATVCPGIRVGPPPFLPCLFLTLHVSPRHLYLVFLPTLEQIILRVSSPLVHQSHGGFCAGTGCLWPPALIPQNGLVLAVPGKRSLEIYRWVAGGPIPGGWILPFLNRTCLVCFCQHPKLRAGVFRGR